MKFFLPLILTMAGLSLTTCAFASHANEEPLDRIVAIVNDAPITQSELNEILALAKKQIASTNSPLPEESVLKKQVLQQMIDKKLQLQLAEQAGLKIDDGQVNASIKRIAEANHSTVSQLYEQVAQQGMTIAEYKQQIREQILLQSLQQHEAGAKINVTPQEIENFKRSHPWQVSNNKEYHLEDIVVSLPDKPTAKQVQEAKHQAIALLAKFKSNTQLANTTTPNNQQALQGSDLGWRKIPEIPSAFAQQVTQMHANEIAGPIQTPNGFHIIHLAGIRGTGEPDPTNKQIENLIYQRKMEEAVQTWLAKIRSQAFVNMHPEN